MLTPGQVWPLYFGVILFLTGFAWLIAKTVWELEGQEAVARATNREIAQLRAALFAKNAQIETLANKVIGLHIFTHDHMTINIREPFEVDLWEAGLVNVESAARVALDVRTVAMKTQEPKDALNDPWFRKSLAHMVGKKFGEFIGSQAEKELEKIYG